MTPDEKIRRANEAQQLMNNPFLKEALERIERQGIEDMLSAHPWARFGDRKRRLAAERVRVIRDVRASLASVIAEGQHAARPGPTIA